jgi:hypothetical protein
MESSKIYFAIQNSIGHAIEFLRNIKTIWACALKSFASPDVGYTIGVTQRDLRVACGPRKLSVNR